VLTCERPRRTVAGATPRRPDECSCARGRPARGSGARPIAAARPAPVPGSSGQCNADRREERSDASGINAALSETRSGGCPGRRGVDQHFADRPECPSSDDDPVEPPCRRRVSSRRPCSRRTPTIQVADGRSADATPERDAAVLGRRGAVRASVGGLQAHRSCCAAPTGPGPRPPAVKTLKPVVGSR
jgi:hypothetical protein